MMVTVADRFKWSLAEIKKMKIGELKKWYEAVDKLIESEKG